MALQFNEFRAWLQDLPPDHAIGYPCDSKDCPISNWLFATTKKRRDPATNPFEVGVWAYTRRRVDGFDHTIMPLWAREFVCMVDERYRPNKPNTVPILVRDAIAILDEVAPTDSASSKGGTGKPQSARLAGATHGPAQ